MIFYFDWISALLRICPFPHISGLPKCVGNWHQCPTLTPARGWANLVFEQTYHSKMFFAFFKIIWSLEWNSITWTWSTSICTNIALHIEISQTSRRLSWAFALNHSTSMFWAFQKLLKFDFSRTYFHNPLMALPWVQQNDFFLQLFETFPCSKSA